MAGWAEMNASSRSGALAAVAIVAALVGWAVWKAPDRSAPAPGQSETAAEAAPEAAAGAGAEVAPEASADAAPKTAIEAAPEVTAIPPTIDVLRVAPDGTTTLAGRAGPGEVISVLVDGAETATVAADGAGQFATIFTLSPSGTARMLSLLARAPDGTVTSGTEEVAIAPMPEPEPQAVAEAAPAADSAAPAGDETAAATEPAGQTDAEAEAPAAEATAEAPPEAPAAIIITDAGAEVLQAPGGAAEAAPAEAVTLQVISYAADGAVQLGGTGAAGAVLRFYLDNAEVASTTVAGDGTWSLTGADVAPGIYTLRIDQLDSAGAVASRIETPFKRETLEALAAAATPAPAAEPAPEAAPAAEPAPDATAGAALTAEAPAQPDAPAGDTTAALPQADAGAATAAGAEAAATPGADAAPQPSAAPITVTVQPGFTLWAIARKNLGRGILYVLVFEANRDQIRDPDLIYPGQVLSLPASP